MQSETQKIEKRKLRYLKNREKNLLYAKEYREKNKGKAKIDNRKWYLKNKKRRKEYSQSDDRKAYQQKYRKTDARKKSLKKYNNSPERKEKMRLYVLNRRRTDISFRIKNNLSRRLSHAIEAKRTTKTSRAIHYVGCTITELMAHLEKLFAPGMNWSNYGKWHIDHIKPCALFDHTDDEQIKTCWHFTNLQPLWAVDNIKKNSFYKGVRILN